MTSSNLDKIVNDRINCRKMIRLPTTKYKIISTSTFCTHTIKKDVNNFDLDPKLTQILNSIAEKGISFRVILRFERLSRTTGLFIATALTTLDQFLITKIDFSFGYTFNSTVPVQCCYSQIFTFNILEILRGQAEYENVFM